MAQPVIVPRESEEMEVCQIIEWYVQRGDRVRAGDALCEVDTGKATFDLEAPAGGTVLDLFYAPGDEAPLLEPIAVIGEEGEEYEGFRPGCSGVEISTPEITVRKAEIAMPRYNGSSADTSMREDQERSLMERPVPAGEGGRRPVSPRARRLAARYGIPLERLEGSGPGGAVVERDIVRWYQALGTYSRSSR